jgi:hypothetical protein
MSSFFQEVEKEVLPVAYSVLLATIFKEKKQVWNQHSSVNLQDMFRNKTCDPLLPVIICVPDE